MTATAYDPATGSYAAEPAYVIARRMRDVINSSQSQVIIDIVAALADGEVVTPDPAPPRPNVITPLYAAPSTSHIINLFGNATGHVFPTFDFGEIEVITYGYSETLGVEHEMVGDGNVFRDQGQILIHSNIVRDSAQFGIVPMPATAVAGPGAAAGVLPHAGRANCACRPERLTPGRGHHQQREPTAGWGESCSAANPAPPASWARPSTHRQHTIHGMAVRGVQVSENASPTISTDRIETGTGISIDATSPRRKWAVAVPERRDTVHDGCDRRLRDRARPGRPVVRRSGELQLPAGGRLKGHRQLGRLTG